MGMREATAIAEVEQLKVAELRDYAKYHSTSRPSYSRQLCCLELLGGS